MYRYYTANKNKSKNKTIQNKKVNILFLNQNYVMSQALKKQYPGGVKFNFKLIFLKFNMSKIVLNTNYANSRCIGEHYFCNSMFC